MIAIDPEFFRMLIADYFSMLAKEHGMVLSEKSSGVTSEGMHFTYRFTRDSLRVKALPIRDYPYLRFLSSDPARQDFIDRLFRKARKRARLGIHPSWFFTMIWEVDSKSWPMVTRKNLPITGWRRLGLSALLDFTPSPAENINEKDKKTRQKMIVNVYTRIPAPCSGYVSSLYGSSYNETIGAICAFALGICIKHPISPCIPAPHDVLEKLPAHALDDPSIMELSKNGVQLDIFRFLSIPGGLEVFDKALNALSAFESASQQGRISIACILYISAAEVLTTPITKWKKRRITDRFISFYSELMPDVIDDIVANPSFEDAFRIERGSLDDRELRELFLSEIYSYRSGLLHQNLSPRYSAHAYPWPNITDVLKVGIIKGFVESAILRFISQPLCSVVGHPTCKVTRAK